MKYIYKYICIISFVSVFRGSSNMFLDVYSSIFNYFILFGILFMGYKVV